MRDDRRVDSALSTISDMTASSSLSCLFIQCIHTSSSLKLQQPPNNEHKLYRIHIKNLTPTSNTPSYSSDLAITRINGLNHHSFASDILIFRLTNQKPVRLRHGLHLHEANFCKADHQHPEVVQQHVFLWFVSVASAVCAVSALMLTLGFLDGTQCNASLSQASCCSCFRKSGLRVSLARVDYEYDDILWFE